MEPIEIAVMCEAFGLEYGEAKVMLVLLVSAPAFLTSEQIILEGWHALRSPNLIKVLVHRIRKKILPMGLCITTDYRQGYAITEPWATKAKLMAEETLLTASRRLVNYLNIDLNRGGFVTEETQKALDALDKQVRVGLEEAKEHHTDLYSEERK